MPRWFDPAALSLALSTRFALRVAAYLAALGLLASSALASGPTSADGGLDTSLGPAVPVGTLAAPGGNPLAPGHGGSSAPMLQPSPCSPEWLAQLRPAGSPDAERSAGADYDSDAPIAKASSALDSLSHLRRGQGAVVNPPSAVQVPAAVSQVVRPPISPLSDGRPPPPGAGSTLDAPFEDDIGPLIIPNDTFFSLHGRSRHVQIGTIKAWQQSFGSRDVVVAVVSDGVDYTHRDLDAKIWRNEGEVPDNGLDDDGNGYVDDAIGWDFAGDIVEESGGIGPVPDNDPMPIPFVARRPDRLVSSANRGTMMAGIVASETNNAYGIAGVSWGARLMPLKVMLEYRFVSGDWLIGAYTRHIVESVCYAADNGADIILLGGFSLTDPLREWPMMERLQAAIDHAYERAGAIVVAPAGECASPAYGCPDPEEYGENPTILPAGFDHVIAVQSVDTAFERRASASTGPWVDIAAPGEGFLTTANTENSFEFTQVGRSHPNVADFAAAHVAGTAALLLTADRWLPPARLERQLCSTANREFDGPYAVVDGLLRNERVGCGSLDADAAIELMPWRVQLSNVDGELVHIAERDELLPSVRIVNAHLNRPGWEVRRDVGWLTPIKVAQRLGRPSEIDLNINFERMETEEREGMRLAAGDSVTTMLRACPVNPRNLITDDTERDCAVGSTSGCHCFEYRVIIADHVRRAFLPRAVR